MNLFDFLYALGFWQWVGVIILTQTFVSGVSAVVVALVSRGKKE